MNRITAFLLVVVAGLAFTAGTMLAGGPGDPPTPSTLAAPIPPGTWGKVPCGGQEAVDILDEIQELAIADRDAGMLDQPTFDQVNNTLYGCATNTPPFTGTEAQHIKNVRMARLFATRGDWELARMKLDHEDD